MPNGIYALTSVQWAMEGTKGTDLAATSKLLCEVFDPEPDDAVYRPTYLAGLTMANTGNEQVITRGTPWKVTGPASYAQMTQWLEMALQGGVTPSGSNPYTWTYTRNATSVPTLDSATFERRISDGSNNIDYAWHYGMLSSLKLTGAPRGVVRLEANGFARRVQTEAITGSLLLPASNELLLHSQSALYIDTTWTGRGTTVVAAQLLQWDYTIWPGNKPFFTADGRSDSDFPVHVMDPGESKVELNATLLVPGSGSQFATEKTAAEAQTLRATELRFTGGVGSDSLKLQALMKHEKGSLFKIGEQDGQNVVQMKLVGSTDATNYTAAVLVNAAANDN